MDRYKKTKIVSILGILANIFLLIIKGIIGVISNSRSMIADAFNSAGDIFSSVMTYIGNKISSKEADEDHNLGHGKAEYIYSLLISLGMITLSLNEIKNSTLSIIKHKELTFSIWLVVVCITTIIIKFLLYLYTKNEYKKTKNILILANSKDHRNDCLITTLNLLSIVLSKEGLYFIDGIAGILISMWILLTGINIFKESYDVLMDKSIDENTKNEVLKIIDRHKEVLKVNHFNSTPVGYKYQISFTIFVDGNLSTFESHNIANTLEREIEKEVEEIYLSVIHVNPMNIK